MRTISLRKLFHLAMVVLAISGTAFTFSSCGGCDETIDPLCAAPEEDKKLLEDSLDIYDKGKAALENAEYEQARTQFHKLIASKDELEEGATVYSTTLEAYMEETNSRLDKARFSFVISNLFAEVNAVLEQGVKLMGLLGVLSPTWEATGTFSPQVAQELVDAYQYHPAAVNPIDDFIDNLLQDVRDFVKESVDIMAKIRTNEGFELVYQQLPVEFVDIRLFDIGGEYDLGEVYFALSLGSFLAGFLDGAQGINFAVELDFSAISELVSYISDDLSFEGNDIVDSALRIVAIVLHTNPDLLTVHKPELIQTGADETADAFGYLLALFDELREDAVDDPDQDDDMLGYFYDEADDREYMKMHFKLSLAIPNPIIDAKKLEGLEVDIEDSFENALENIELAFRGQGDGLIEWSRDIVPLISLAAVTLLKSGAFDVAITSFGGEEAADQIDGVLSSGLLSTDLISSLVTSFIPNVFRLNIKDYIANPQGGMRAIFPLWTVPQDGYDKRSIQKVYVETADGPVLKYQSYDSINFIYDYECFKNDRKIDPVKSGDFLCTSDVGSLEDSRHFDTVSQPTLWIKDDLVGDDDIVDTWTTDAPSKPEIDFQGDEVTDLTEAQEQGLYFYTYNSENFKDIHNAYAEAITESPAKGFDNNDYVKLDGKHFGINPDGLKNIFPYLAFQDASAGGLIEYNFADAGFKDDAEVAMDDLTDHSGTSWATYQTASPGQLSRALNAILANLSDKIAGLL